MINVERNKRCCIWFLVTNTEGTSKGFQWLRENKAYHQFC